VSRLLLATTNPGKQAELRRLLAELQADVVTPDQVGLTLEVDEPHDTYAENAVTKALAYADASGLVSLADDSGIEVAALDWGPGARSARWAAGRGAERLLETLEGVTDRRARMVCVVAIARPGCRLDEVDRFTGVLHGTIARERRGAGGFGYDPVFLLPSGMTTAELPQEEKDRLSHRGQAVHAALGRIAALLAEGTRVP
jgi:XTP/dITP diphosphohydrolase